MKGFSFQSFVVHDTNQAAYDICTKVAAAKKDLPCPIVLFGESGSGKTHLLWAIVNHFRERDAKVGVALISAQDFPSKVKSLPDNPDKLKKKYPVILMVDELHLFEDNLQELERVMAAFKQHNQYVIVATNIHPSILPALGQKTKDFLNGGVIVNIEALPKTEGSPVPEVVVKQLMTLKARVAELEGGKGASGGAGQGDAALREELEKTRHERDVARTALERSEGELIDLREEMAQLRAGATADDAAEAAAAVQQLEKKKEALVERIAALEDQLDELIGLAPSLGDAQGAGGQPAAGQLTAAQEESELFRVIDGIKETLKQYEGTTPDEAPPEKAQQMLSTIVDQLKSLEKKPADSGAGNETP